MQKRGISPLIATILIIAFTIVLAAIIFIWLSGSVEEIKTKQEIAEKELSCIDVSLEFKKSCIENSYVNLLVENKGNKEIKAELFRLKGNLNTNITNKIEPIVPFGAKSFNLLYNPFVIGKPEKIELFPIIDYNNENYQCKNLFSSNIQECPCPVENLERTCGTDIGECVSGKEKCQSSKWSECSGILEPLAEICDNKDNDCDGSVDENCPCITGFERECSANLGVCKGGKQTCENGKWSECDKTPSGEICNDNLDNDCDGSIDEMCQCTQSKDCGPVSLDGTGICKKGTQTCVSGYLADCLGAVYPKKRDCASTVDNDCNGIPDIDDAKKEITTAVGAQTKPSIYNNIIVWEDYRRVISPGINTDIYMYDLSTETEKQVTDEDTLQENPTVYGDIIIWHDNRNGDNFNTNYDIYLYNINTLQESRITNELTWEMYPQIYNNIIIWQDHRNAPYNPDIYMCDLTKNGQDGGCLANDKKTQITSSTAQDRKPEIYENIIVWFRGTGKPARGEIFMCDLNKNGQLGGCLKDDVKTQITKKTTIDSTQYDPKIYENIIVWNGITDGNGDGIGDNTDIFMCDLNKNGQLGGCLKDDNKMQITTDPSNQRFPEVYKNLIIYESWNTILKRYDLYAYNLVDSNYIRITNDQEKQSSYYDIYNGKIIYTQEKGYGNLDIFMYDSEQC